MSFSALNPETVALNRNKIVYVKRVSVLFSDTAIHSLDHIPDHNPCKDVHQG
jgi:hypothetical protein